MVVGGGSGEGGMERLVSYFCPVSSALDIRSKIRVKYDENC